MLSFLDLLQIGILAAAIYFVVDLFWGTRSFQMIFGLVLLLTGMTVLAKLLHLEVLEWLLNKLSLYLALAVLVIFQQEIRQVLAYIGRRRITIDINKKAVAGHVEQLVSAVEELARNRHGALIAYQREISLAGYKQNGTLLNAPLVSRLLASIFYPNAPLHDGGVIVEDGMIVAARCIFPLSTSGGSDNYGMRHRAALGLSEETDALVIIVSEEQGTVSMAFQGRLLQNITPARLARYLEALMPKEGFIDAWRRIVANIDTGDKTGEADWRRETAKRQGGGA